MPKYRHALGVLPNPLGVPEHFRSALNVAFFVCHKNFRHFKLCKLQEVKQESVHTYTL